MKNNFSDLHCGKSKPGKKKKLKKGKRNQEIIELVLGNSRYLQSRSAGIIAVSEDGKKKDICSYICLCAHLTDEKSGKVMVKAEFKNINSQLKSVLIAPADFDKGAHLTDQLLNSGHRIHNRQLAKIFLSDLYQCKPPKKNILLVSEPGWHSTDNDELKAYVVNGKTFVPEGTSYNIELSGDTNTGFSSKGTHKGWLKEVAAPCQGNPRLIIMMCASLLGPLLDLLGFHNIGIHIFGMTKAGKTTGFIVACSIYGNKNLISSWNATTNALQETAVSHNDSFLLLDEIKQCEAKQVSAAAYDLINGVTKNRLRPDGKLNSVKHARLVVISNGETSLEKHLLEAEIKVTPGQLVRLISIPIHPSEGMFSDTHEETSKKDFAARLRRNADANYGTAGLKWIRYLVDNQRELRRTLPAQVQEIEMTILASLQADELTDSQHDVARSMASIACAGEMAISNGILPWPKGDAIKAAKVCYKAWYRHENGASASRNPLLSIKKFFSDNQDGFIPLGKFNRAMDSSVYSHVVDGEEVYLVTPAHFDDSLFKQHGKKLVLDEMKKRGLLVLDRRGCPTRQVPIPMKPKFGKPSFYVIRKTMLTTK